MILFEELKFLLVLFFVCGIGPAVVWCLLGCFGLPRQAEDLRGLAAVVSGHYRKADKHGLSLRQEEETLR